MLRLLLDISEGVDASAGGKSTEEIQGDREKRKKREKTDEGRVGIRKSAGWFGLDGS